MADYPAGTQWAVGDTGRMSYENDPSQINWSQPGPIDTYKQYGVDPSFYPEDVRQQLYAHNTGTTVPSGSGGGGGGSGGSPIDDLLNGASNYNQAQLDLQKGQLQSQIDQANRNYQLAQNADQRQAALLDLQRAQYQLSVLQFAEQQKQFAQSQYSDLAKTLLGTATSLQGPADYAKFMQYVSGGKSLMDQLYGSTPRPTYSSPVGTNEPLTLEGLMKSIGLSDSGSSRDGGTTQSGGQAATPQQVPLPYQINPSVWDSLGNTGQQIILGLASKQGWDPNEFQNQLNASRPTGNAPKMTTYNWAP